MLNITNPAAVCEPAKVDITVAAVTSGSTLPAGTTLTYFQNSNGAPGPPITSTAAQTLGNGTYWIKATTNTNPICSDQKSVVVTVNSKPATPSADVTQPTCAVATGTITVNSADATITYTLTGPGPATTTQSNTTGSFPNLAAGTYGLTASKNGCTSSSVSK